MRGEFSNIRGCLVVAAAIAALLFAAGCGGGSGDGGSVTVGEITVQTGSLSKDEFVEKADEICRTTRSEFDNDYSEFTAKATGKQQPRAVLFKEVVESVVLPDLEKEIEKISELGAPADYADEVASYLSALKRRLDEGRANPIGLISAVDTFEKPTAAARKAGLNGCAASLS